MTLHICRVCGGSDADADAADDPDICRGEEGGRGRREKKRDGDGKMTGRCDHLYPAATNVDSDAKKHPHLRHWNISVARRNYL